MSIKNVASWAMVPKTRTGQVLAGFNVVCGVGAVVGWGLPIAVAVVAGVAQHTVVCAITNPAPEEISELKKRIVAARAAHKARFKK